MEDQAGGTGDQDLIMMRYVDDSRVALPPVLPGWRWEEQRLKYSQAWEQEDRMTGEQRTRELLGKTMSGIEEYLEFTVESGE